MTKSELHILKHVFGYRFGASAKWPSTLCVEVGSRIHKAAQQMEAEGIVEIIVNDDEATIKAAMRGHRL